METKYKRGLDHTYMILEFPVLYEEDYQIKMMQANRIEGLLPVAGQGVDGKSQYFYEISGKVSLRALYEKVEMTEKELRELLLQILKTVRTIRKFMLDAGRLLFDPEYIFYEDENYYFCYLPAKDTDLCKEFHKLTEYFVSRIDHREMEGIQIAYELHKATMEENYNLEKILEKMKKKEEKKVSYEMPEIIITDVDYEAEEFDNTQNPVLKEKSFLWKKRKKGKWGDWTEKL